MLGLLGSSDPVPSVHVCPASTHWDNNVSTCMPDSFECADCSWGLGTWFFLVAAFGVGVIVGRKTRAYRRRR